jgi:hypothetical protein
MGSGSYCFAERSIRAEIAYEGKSSGEIFASSINEKMSPNGVTLRESRDNDNNPSFPIILALDVTGSMGSIPTYLIKEGLPKLVDKIIQAGIAYPQLLFVAVGDHECDKHPLQIGQFEASDVLLDYWLESVFLEGGGGGNNGESYGLAHYFAGYHTEHDSFVKRHKKGVLITIGDELNLPAYPKKAINRIMGTTYQVDFSSADLLDKAKELYDIYHIHTNSASRQAGKSIAGDWKQLLGEHLVEQHDKNSIANTIADVILKSYTETEVVKEKVSPVVPSNPEEIL